MTRRPVPTIPADLESRLLEAHFTGETPTPSKRLRACVLERVAQDHQRPFVAHLLNGLSNSAIHISKGLSCHACVPVPSNALRSR